MSRRTDLRRNPSSNSYLLLDLLSAELSRVYRMQNGREQVVAYLDFLRRANALLAQINGDRDAEVVITGPGTFPLIVDKENARVSDDEKQDDEKPASRECFSVLNRGSF